jgi:hypothetical protein
MVDHILKKNFTDFLADNSNKKFELAQNRLKNYRNIKISDFSLVESRCLWMVLLVYKFKKDMEITEYLWIKAKLFILSVLRNESDWKEKARDYLDIFNKWKTDDFLNFVSDIASFYYNLTQIKKSIELQNDKNSMSEWEPHYNDLMLKVREASRKMGFLQQLDQIVLTMEDNKYKVVEEMMAKVYWDMIEKEIEQKNYDTFFRNLEEIKQNLIDISPTGYDTKLIHEYIDIDFLKQLFRHEVFDKDNIIASSRHIINYLKEWDALHFRQIYDKELLELTNNIVENTFSNGLRLFLEKSTILTLNLVTRKNLWKKLLSENLENMDNIDL